MIILKSPHIITYKLVHQRRRRAVTLKEHHPQGVEPSGSRTLKEQFPQGATDLGTVIHDPPDSHSLCYSSKH